MVTRLSTGDWFTAKVSACGLFTAAYKHIEEHDQRTLLRAQVFASGVYQPVRASDHILTLFHSELLNLELLRWRGP